MESVIIALQPQFAVETGRKTEEKGAGQKSNTIEEIENRFAGLEVEEPAEVSLEEAATPKPPKDEPTFELQGPNKEDVEEEKLFAIYCLFDDLNRLRSYIQKVW